jgi:hypothetical protein
MSRFGVFAALLLAALLLAAAAQASSATPPLGGLRPLKIVSVVKLAGTARTHATCIAHSKQLHGTAARIDRKLSPVSCEQPPRAHVKNVDLTPVFAP